MKEVTLEQLKSMAQHDYYAIWNKAKGLNRDVKIYVHWTAGRYNQLFDDYHVLITGEGRVTRRICAIPAVLQSPYVAR